MPRLIAQAARFPQENIILDEFFGRISSGQSDLSLCRIVCEKGWSEPAQRPEFDEYMIVTTGSLYITGETGQVTIIRAGQAAKASRGEKVQYSTPEGPCDYISVCVPAFSLDKAHRES